MASEIEEMVDKKAEDKEKAQAKTLEKSTRKKDAKKQSQDKQEVKQEVLKKEEEVKESKRPRAKKKKSEGALRVLLAPSSDKAGEDSLDELSGEGLEVFLNASDKFFYLASENTGEEIKEFSAFLESNAKNFKLHKIHFGLDERDFVYELHIV